MGGKADIFINLGVVKNNIYKKEKISTRNTQKDGNHRISRILFFRMFRVKKSCQGYCFTVREPVVNAWDWYITASRGGEDEFGGAVTITVVIWFALLLIYIVISLFVRWPFWRRWTVILKNVLPHHRCEALFSWRNDRTHLRESTKKFSFFFRVIPATPKTNRLLTGRRLFATNPGWKQPHQVVLITAEGSFPLPCGDAVEQEEIFHRISRFADEMLSQR